MSLVLKSPGKRAATAILANKSRKAYSTQSHLKVNKKKMWSQFESEVGTKEVPLECIYDISRNRETCDVCNSSLSMTEERFQACTNKDCGLIYKDVLDQSPEWRYFGDDSNGADPARCGMPINPLLEKSSYALKVNRGGAQTYEMQKLRRFAAWQGMPYAEKARYEEFQHISLMAGHAGLPKLIVEDAMREHKRISGCKTFRGLNREGIIAASIYVACKINNCPRTAKEIASIFMLDKTSATKGCKTALTLIDELEQDKDESERTSLIQTSPDAFIGRFCSKLNICEELTKLCLFLALRIQQLKYIPENTPHSIAAGIVYFVANVCNVEVSKQDVNRITGISEVTINKCFKKLEGLKKELIPTPIAKKYKVQMS